MRYVRYSIIALLALSLACEFNNPYSNSATSTVTMAVAFPGDVQESQDGRLGKGMSIEEVRVRIFAEDMDEIIANLTMRNNGEQASGSVEVPKGDARTFHVTLWDENQIRQYEGQDVFDIVDDEESIQMDVFGIRPEAVDLTINLVTAESVVLSWTQSQAVDFAEYMIIRTRTPDISQNPQIVRRIFLRSNRAYIDSTVQPDQDYYYAVLAIDTEGLFNISPVRGVHTARIQNLAYHDNIAEDIRWGTLPGDRCEVEFTSPNYPCYIRAIRLKLHDESGSDGNYRVYVEDVQTETELFYSVPLPTDPATASIDGAWVTWLFNWDNRTQGTVNGDFWAGIEYATDNWWPDLLLDNSVNRFRSYFYDSGTDTWYDELGNYLMTIEVEIGGRTLGKVAGATVDAHDRLVPAVALARAGEINPPAGVGLSEHNWAQPETSGSERAARSPRP